MGIAQKVANGFVWFWIWIFIIGCVCFGVGGLIHIINHVIQ